MSSLASPPTQSGPDTTAPAAPRPTAWQRLGRSRWRIGQWLGYLWYAAFVLIPIYWIASSSLTPRNELLSVPPNYIPPSLTLDNYRRLAESLPFGSYLANSLIVSIGSGLLAVVVSFSAAYAFARVEFRFKNAAFAFFMLTATLPSIATVIPLFRLFNQLGLVNTRQGLILLMGSAMAPFTVWIMATFIRQIPREIEEAASVDGASVMRRMLQITVPLTLPAIATLFLINFITAWNELFYPLVFAKGPDAKPLTLGLVELTQGAGEGAGRPWHLMSALSMVMVIPTVLLVTVFQRLIVQGLTRGAVK